MAVIAQHNDGASLVLRVSFADLDGAPATPASAEYRVDCVTTGTAVLPWTTVAPAAVVDIHITGAQNAIIDSDNDFEKRRVTVRWVSSGYDGTDEYIYALKNLGGIP